MKRILIIMLIFTCVGTLWAQTKSQKADKSFHLKNYAQAIKIYQEDVKKAKEVDRKDYYFQIAESYRLMNQYEKAIQWYNDAMTLGYVQPQVYLSLGDVYSGSGKLQEAIDNYSKYLKVFPEDATAITRLKSCTHAQDKSSSGNSYNVLSNEKLLNSEASEYAPAFFNDKLVFASMRGEIQNDLRSGQTYSKLYLSDYDMINKRFVNPIVLSSPLNNKLNNGSFAFDVNTSTAYFMQSNSNGTAAIVSSKLSGTSWSKTSVLPFCQKQNNYGHPTLTKDGRTMFFVSDMPKGMGGRDIWMIKKTSTGNWGPPINCGPNINTPGDEMFPYLINDKLLFFSSNGMLGFGGLDNYVAHFNENGFKPAINLGVPFNSSSDDFGLIVRENKQGGLFSSNRPGGIGNDDIYSFTNFPMILDAQGKVTDLVTGKPLAGVKVCYTTNAGDSGYVSTNDKGEYNIAELVPNNTYTIITKSETYYNDIRKLTVDDREFYKTFSSMNGDDIDFALLPMISPLISIKGSVIERQTRELMPNEMMIITGPGNFQDIEATKKDGIYSFTSIRPGNYVVKIQKNGYWSESRECKAANENMNRVYSYENDYDMNFELTKIEPKKEIVLNNIFYDFAKATLRPESMVELEKVVSMLNETPNISIQISAHTDIRGSAQQNQLLSEQRAKSVVEYLISRGISRTRLISKGYGFTMLLIPNAKTEEEHQQNRRTTFQVTKVAAIAQQSQYVPKTIPLTYRIYIIASDKIKNEEMYFSKLKRYMPETKVNQIESVVNNMLSYDLGIIYKNLHEAVEAKALIKEMGYVDCIIVPFQGGQRLTVNQAVNVLTGQ